MKIGRNDPCYCGSGKKYKKCCIGKEVAFTDSAKFAALQQSDPAFTPRRYYVDRIAGLDARLQGETRTEALESELMTLAGDLLDDLDGGRLHAFTRYGEGFRPSERRLLQELANRIWGGLVLGGFQEQDVLRALTAFAAAALTEGFGETPPPAGARLFADAAGNLLRWELTPGQSEANDAESFELDVRTEKAEA